MYKLSASTDKNGDKGYYKGFKPVEVKNLKQLGKLMLTHSLTPQLFGEAPTPTRNGEMVEYRKAIDNISGGGQVIFFDIDNKMKLFNQFGKVIEERVHPNAVTLDQIVAKFKSLGWGCVITPSRSSTPEWEKFHIGAFTTKPIGTHEEYKSQYVIVESKLGLDTDVAMRSSVQNMTPALGKKILAVVKGKDIPLHRLSIEEIEEDRKITPTTNREYDKKIHNLHLENGGESLSRKGMIKLAVKAEGKTVRCGCHNNQSHGNNDSGAICQLNDNGSVHYYCAGCDETIWLRDEPPMTLGGRVLDPKDLPSAPEIEVAEVKEGMSEEEIKEVLLDASLKGAFSLNSAKTDIKKVTGINLGTLDAMVKEKVASSLDEYFHGHICWDSVRGLFMEVREESIRMIKKANFAQTVMSRSGWMTPSDVSDVLHGAEDVSSDYRPDLKDRYFDGVYGEKMLNLHFGVSSVGTGSQIPELIDKVLDNLFKEEPEAKEYFIHWMAYIVQTGKRTGVAWGFHGAETGTGKGLIVEVLALMLGHDNCSINVGNEGLAEKFNGYIDRKQLVHFNEIAIDARSRHSIAGKLKALVSDPVLQLRLMGTDTFSVSNHCNVILNSNKHNPLELEQNDRRWNIIRTESKLNDLDWFHEADGTGDEVLAESLQFKAYLERVEVDRHKATHIMPMSKAKQDIIEATTSQVEMLANKINNRDDDIAEYLGIDPKNIWYKEIEISVINGKFSNELLCFLYSKVSKNENPTIVEMNRFFKKPYIKGVAGVFLNTDGKTVRGITL